MRRLLFGVACALVGACSQSFIPTTPTAMVTTQLPTAPPPDARVGYTGPVHHNVPFILPDGVTPAWLCETKPRAYTRPDGAVEWTLDHYALLGQGGCPDVPID